MKKYDYPSIINTLKLHSSQVGLEEHVIRKMYKRNHESNAVLRNELSRIFDDAEVDWCELLYNKEYEVCEFDTQEEAKAYAKKILLDSVVETQE